VAISEQDRINLQKLTRKMGGENARMLLSVLGREKAFVDAITSPLGEELMSDVVNSLEARFELVINEKDSPETRAEIRALREILRKWQKKINQYEQNKEKLMKALK
jgi:hypothetical protein